MIDWPLDSNVIRRGLVNHTFGMVRNGGKRAHQGWDFAAPLGTACYAIAPGKAHAVYDAGAYGLTLVLEFQHEGDTLYAAYAHLSKVHVEPGERVEAGTLVAFTGESGNAAGMALADQHLHFEIRTIPRPGMGLAGRLSPLVVFGKCPMKTAIKRRGLV